MVVVGVRQQSSSSSSISSSTVEVVSCMLIFFSVSGKNCKDISPVISVSV